MTFRRQNILQSLTCVCGDGKNRTQIHISLQHTYHDLLVNATLSKETLCFSVKIISQHCSIVVLPGQLVFYNLDMADPLKLFMANPALQLGDGKNFLTWSKNFESALYLQDTSGANLCVIALPFDEDKSTPKAELFVYFTLFSITTGRANQIVSAINKTEDYPGHRAYNALYDEFVKTDPEAQVQALTNMLELKCQGTDINTFETNFGKIIDQLRITKVFDPSTNKTLINCLIFKALTAEPFRLFTMLHKSMIMGSTAPAIFVTLREFCRTSHIDVTGAGKQSATPGSAYVAVVEKEKKKSTCGHCLRDFHPNFPGKVHVASTCPHKLLNPTEARKVQAEAKVQALAAKQSRYQPQSRATSHPLTVGVPAVANSATVSQPIVSVVGAAPIMYQVTYQTTTPPTGGMSYLAHGLQQKALPSLIGASVSAKAAQLANQQTVVIDSGASGHFVTNKALFTGELIPLAQPFPISGFNEKSAVYATHSGLVKQVALDINNTEQSVYYPAYFCPNGNGNLFSTTISAAAGNEFHQTQEVCQLVLNGVTFNLDVAQGIPQLQFVTKALAYTAILQTNSTQLVVDLLDQQYTTANVAITQLLQIPTEKFNQAFKATGKYEPSQAELVSAHLRFGHLNYTEICALMTWETPSAEMLEKIKCDVCLIHKSKRQPTTGEFKNSATHPGQFTYMDTIGPFPPSILTQKCYGVDFVDAFSGNIETYSIVFKSEASLALQQYTVDMAQKQVFVGLGSVLFSDGGGEYVSYKSAEQLLDMEAKQHLSPPYTPQPNRSERAHYTITTMAMCMLESAGMSKIFWPLARKYATFIYNHVQHISRGGKIPACELSPIATHIDNQRIRTFGAKAFVHIDQSLRTKLSPAAFQGRFVGFCPLTQYALIFNPETNKIVSAKHVQICDVVLERSTAALDFKVIPTPNDMETSGDPQVDLPTPMPLLPTTQPTPIAPEAILPGSMQTSVDVEPGASTHNTTTLTRRSARQHASTQARDASVAAAASMAFCYSTQSTLPTVRSEAERMSDAFDDSTIIQDDSDLTLLPKPTKLSNGTIINIPTSELEAMSGPNNLLWRAAMETEKLKMAATATLSVCYKSDLPPGSKVVGYKWVFTLKNDAPNARLTLQGFSQIPGLHYFETSSPTVDTTTLKLFWGVATDKHMHVLQGDVKGAYLQVEFTDAVVLHMNMPLSWQATESNNTVLAVNKPIYGAKQAGLEFYRAFNEYMQVTLQFTQSINDPCLYTRHTLTDSAQLVLHVDDFLLGATTEKLTWEIGRTIEKRFTLSKLGLPTVFTGVEIQYDVEAGFVELRLTSMLSELITRAGMEGCKPASTPIDPTMLKSLLKDSELSDRPLTVEQAKMYSTMVCTLLWATKWAPDLQFTVNYLARKLTCPTVSSRILLKHLCRYIAGRLDLPLRFGGGNTTLLAATDASWGGITDTHSQSGGVIFFKGAAVYSSSNVQPVTALSSFEAELYSTSELTPTIIYVRNELQDDFKYPQSEATVLLTDNTGTIKLANSITGTSRTKHLRYRISLLRDLILSKIIILRYCPTSQMSADMLTKPEERMKQQQFRAMLHGL